MNQVNFICYYIIKMIKCVLSIKGVTVRLNTKFINNAIAFILKLQIFNFLFTYLFTLNTHFVDYNSYNYNILFL